MTKMIILEAQDYLTMEKEDGYKRIVDIHDLMKRHNVSEVILFLKDYFHEKEKALRNLLLMDKTQKRIDEYVAAMFRMAMAIKTLEEAKEVKPIVWSQHRTEKGSQLHKRNRSHHSRSRFGENGSHDEKNRHAREQTQRVA